MRKFLILLALVLFVFYLEYIFFNILGWWFVPNLLLLLVVFITLFLGIRFGLLAAVLAGLIKDSYGPGFFGVHLYSFVICAYVSTIIWRYIYTSTESSKYLLVFYVCIIYVLVQIILRVIFSPIDIFQVVRYILMPQLFATLIVMPYTFQQLRKCASKLFA